MTPKSETQEQEIIEKALKILEFRLRERQPTHRMLSSWAINKFLVLNYAELDYESFGILFLDKHLGLIEHRHMFRGTIDFAKVHYREVLRDSMKFNASNIILVHNHPSGIFSPSEGDQRLTDSLQMLLEMVEIKLIDHVIVAGTQTFSFAEAGLLE